MRRTLPIYLIHYIIALSCSPRTVLAQSHVPVASPSVLPHTSSSTPLPTPLTLWDLGFSLREKWADLRDAEECPVESDLVPVYDAQVGDQAVMENIVVALRNVTETPAVVNDSSGEDNLVSFEDWKRLKGEESDEVPVEAPSQITANQASLAPSVLNENTTQISKDSVNNNNLSDKAYTHNNYNYASPDCSARIHSSSPQTLHASSLLHKSRDRYMLTPCKAAQHWVVVELCDEILIESIETAVWEFFSGVIREVVVSVGGEESDGDGWEEVGRFVGKNVRGVQTFTLSNPTSFHRFVRLDFPSNYGTEYYCPISQLKVYGMNQMEAFKWEQKRIVASHIQKRTESEELQREHDEALLRVRRETEEQIRQEQRRSDEEREKALDELEKLVMAQASRAGSSFLTFADHTPIMDPSSTISTALGTQSAPVSITNSTTSVNADASNTSTSMSASTVTSQSARVSSRSDSSESIYAQIVRRLNALEGNSSLVARYIEEQTQVMRIMLGRVEKSWDVWRASREQEEERKREDERSQRDRQWDDIVAKMDERHQKMDMERKEILHKLRSLTDDIGYERRRGIAQLAVMLVIIVLGVVSRSTAIDAVLKPLLADVGRKRSAESIYEGVSVRSRGPPKPLTNSREAVARRPGTPSRSRHPANTLPYRSFSEKFPTSPIPTSPSQSGLRIKTSLASVPKLSSGPRRLARSSHLHTMHVDRSKDHHTNPPMPSKPSMPRMREVAEGSDRSTKVQHQSDEAIEQYIDRGEWGTDGEVSEVDDEVNLTPPEVKASYKA